MCRAGGCPGARRRPGPGAEHGPAPAARLQAVRLSDTVTVLVDGPLPALDTLRQAATPLLELLAATQAATRKDSR
ncbi:hypothetical protein BZL30_7651 [Mycobacterium kansasii]|uniref:Uncharacterized protein n=1 Tax=Mycobacterium kansasii TaxID=1768 RepID=A0A1V3WKH4_MYCKA|nr:hypothetical protein BZL30_7651 [Mycobacterium kansasii]